MRRVARPTRDYQPAAIFVLPQTEFALAASSVHSQDFASFAKRPPALSICSIFQCDTCPMTDEPYPEFHRFPPQRQSFYNQ